MANIDVFEKSDLKIKVKLKQKSKKDNDTAQLIKTVDNLTVSTESLSVRKQWVEVKHTFADVPDDKDNYQFKYRVTHDGETIQGADTYTVWPRTAKVTLKNDADDTPLPDAYFDLKFANDEVSHFQTDGSGERECKLKQKSIWGIGDMTRLVFVTWDGATTGRVRVARMRVVKYKATLELPAWTDATRTQYVNTKSEKKGKELGHDGLGRSVAFTVKLVDADDPTRELGPDPNQQVFIKATLTDMTKRTANTPTLVDVKELDASTPGVVTGTVKSDNAHRARFTLRLGLGGKEKCKLEVGTTNACSDAKVEFINKRKLWVQSIAAAGATPSLANATGAMDNVGIELARDADVVLAPNDAPAGAMLPGAVFGQGSDMLVIGDHNVGAFTKKWTKEHAPLSAYLIFCDYQFDAGRRAQSTSISYDTVDADPFTCTPLSEDYVLLPKNLHNGKCAVVGTWKSNATTGTHKGAKGAIPDNCYGVDWAGDPGKLTITLPALAKAVVDGGETLTITLKVTYAEGEYNGWTPSTPRGGVVIALRNSDGARIAADMNKTVVHELGHLLNQVGETAGTGLTLDVDHEWNYTGRGHLGGHCAFGVSKGVYDGGGSMEGQGAATCVMYGEASDNKSVDFCVKCAPFVKAEPMEKLT